jgi:hypothetical protein
MILVQTIMLSLLRQKRYLSKNDLAWKYPKSWLGTIIPPSVSTDWPVMFLAFGLTRKLTRFAISSGSWTSQKTAKAGARRRIAYRMSFQSSPGIHRVVEGFLRCYACLLRDVLRDLVPHLPACQDQCHGQGILLTSVGTGPGQYAAKYSISSHVHVFTS